MNRVMLIEKNGRLAIDLKEFGVFYPTEKPKEIYQWQETKVRVKGIWEKGNKTKNGYLECYLKREGVEIPKNILSFSIFDENFNLLLDDLIIL